jgi:hypothetical protein
VRGQHGIPGRNRHGCRNLRNAQHLTVSGPPVCTITLSSPLSPQATSTAMKLRADAGKGKPSLQERQSLDD